MFPSLVGCDWLKANLEDEDLILLDASPKSNISGKTSPFANTSIPSARYFDLKNVFSDQKAELPNTWPEISQFEKEARKLGINQKSKIVVFDNLGIYSSPRVWWMFRAFGHQEVAVLDGGMPAWINKSYPSAPLESKVYSEGDFVAQLNSDSVLFIDEIVENASRPNRAIIDARSKGRFDGTSPEPREGLSSGHIPNSYNLPYGEVLDGGFMKSQTELQKLFSAFPQNNPWTFSCGSGLTACITILAAEQVSDTALSVYDGSWTEWAQSGNRIDKTE